MISLAVAAAILLSPAQHKQDAPPVHRANYKVKVDGKTYRVTVRGRTVEVANKAIVTTRSPEGMTRMREAVSVATGCKMVDGFWVGNVIQGLLTCDGN